MRKCPFAVALAMSCLTQDAETPDGRHSRPRGQLSYNSIGADGKSDGKDKTGGTVIFDLVYWVKGDYIYIEFTNMEFMGLRAEMGKFEDARPLGNDGVHYLTEKQMPWSKIKNEYFERLQLVGRDLVRFMQYYYKTPLGSIHYKGDKQPW